MITLFVSASISNSFNINNIVGKVVDLAEKQTLKILCPKNAMMCRCVKTCVLDDVVDPLFGCVYNETSDPKVYPSTCSTRYPQYADLLRSPDEQLAELKHQNIKTSDIGCPDYMILECPYSKFTIIPGYPMRPCHFNDEICYDGVFIRHWTSSKEKYSYIKCKYTMASQCTPIYTWMLP
jgi:hypothetical protein